MTTREPDWQLKGTAIRDGRPLPTQQEPPEEPRPGRRSWLPPREWIAAPDVLPEVPGLHYVFTEVAVSGGAAMTTDDRTDTGARARSIAESCGVPDWQRVVRVTYDGVPRFGYDDGRPEWELPGIEETE